MVRCDHCTRDCPETTDPNGSVSCGNCGKVRCDNVFLHGDDVKGYLNTKQEYLYKKIIWEAMNKDYLQEQAEKERYGRSKKSTDKRRRQKRATNADSAKTAAKAMAIEETRTKKRLSSKINYNVLDKLFDEEEKDPFVVPPSGKRTRVEAHNESDEDRNEVGAMKKIDDDEEQYEADTEKFNDNEEEEQENGEEEEEEEEDTEEWRSRNGEEECDYGYDDEGDEECW